MEPVIRRTWKWLVWLGLMLPVPAVAQEPIPRGVAIPEPEYIQPGPAQAQPQLQPQPQFQPHRPLPRQSQPQPSQGPWRTGDDAGCWDGGIFGPGSPPPCCELCGYGSGPPPHWYVETEARVLARSRPFWGINTTLVPRVIANAFGQLQPARVPLMETRSVDFGISPGLAVTLGRWLGRDEENRDRFLELTYWGLNHWERSLEANTHTRLLYPILDPFGVQTGLFQAGELFSNFPHSVGGFNRADSHVLSVQSDVNNVELNYRFSPRNRPDRWVAHPSGRWRRECQPGFYCSYLVGLRYLDITDEFHLRGRANILTAEGEKVATGEQDVRTRNDLLGCQVGGELTYRACRWTADMHGKAGPYLNIAEQHTRIITDAVGKDPAATADINAAVSANRNVAAVIGEFGFAFAYKFQSNLIGRASYDFLWAGNLALTTPQVSSIANPPPTIDTQSAVFMHGLSLGLEYAW